MHDPLLPLDFATARLRRLRRADRAAFQAYRALPELGRFQSWSQMTDEEADRFIDEVAALPVLAPGEWIQLALADRQTDRLLGDIGLWVSPEGDQAEIGFTVAPWAQGRGVATQATHAVHGLLARASNVRVLRGITDARNGASVRVLERAGFLQVESRDAVFRGESCVERVYERPVQPLAGGAAP
jgi:RimJ/RimL family protein N-acetyltransferase